MALLGTDTKVTGPLKEGVLLLETFRGKESLGTPYRYDLTLLSEKPNIPVKDVLGHSLTIHIKLDTGETRYFNGIVTYFAKAGLAMKHTRYLAVLCPKTTLFDYTRDCRILFDGDVPKHVTDLLGKRGFGDVDAGALQGSYRQREYTVQYRESDFNFIQRLLEEEGIYYFFKHEDDKHLMVLGDSASAHAPVAGYESILYMPRQRKQAREEEHFWSLHVADSLYPGKFSVLRGYDYEQARAKQPQIIQKHSPLDKPGGDFEDYDYPGGLSEEPDAEAWGQVSLDAAHVANTMVTVEGNTMGLGAGDLVKLRRPPAIADDFNPFWLDGDFDKEYLITSATYAISINQYETGDVAESDEPFRATYTLLDSQAPFRPGSTATKPRIEGPQTALVVGPAGEEIYTDKLGRVKVQFDWDRLGQRDEKSSIWVRVAQVWAGKQWGAIHIPRIGHEVIVAFLDGDPDRPIITGRVYNADNMPPYQLPANGTQSGIKSRSSKGGTAGNFNELRFEDKKGSEEIYLQAEKDLTIVVEHDETRTVGHDRTKEVGHDETSTIKGNRTETVNKDETITIDGSRGETVGKQENISIGANRTETVGGNETISVGGNRSEDVGGNESVSIGGNRSHDVGGNATDAIGGARKASVGKSDTLSVGAARNQEVAGDDNLKVGKKLIIDAADQVVIKTGDASITMKKDGTITLKGKDITLDASGKINAKASGDVIIKGSKVAQN
jgi:type VI secretion system secreted protein VgrG